MCGSWKYHPKWFFFHGGWGGIGFQPKITFHLGISLWRSMSDLMCPLCLHQHETSQHIFLFCEVATKIRNACYQWRSPHIAIFCYIWILINLRLKITYFQLCGVWLFFGFSKKGTNVDLSTCCLEKYGSTFVVWSWLSSLSSSFNFSFIQWCNNVEACLISC